MTPILWALCALGYLAFGFYLGIVREWAAQERTTYTRRVTPTARTKWAFFFFPLTMYDIHYGGPIHVSVCTSRGMGYWMIIAVIWPVPVAYSCYMFVVDCIFRQRPIKFFGGFEAMIKRFARIDN